MIYQSVWGAEDFDQEGRLRAPKLFWLSVGIQMKTWGLLGGALASGQHESTLLSLIYPNLADIVMGLVIGLVGVLVLVIYPLRDRFSQIACLSYKLLLCANIVGLGYAVVQIAWSPTDSLLWCCLGCIEMASLFAQYPDRRLRQVFIFPPFCPSVVKSASVDE
ncbi:DUF2919 family protein [Salmonella enterica]